MYTYMKFKWYQKEIDYFFLYQESVSRSQFNETEELE